MKPSQETEPSLDQIIDDFNREVKLMMNRIEAVTAKFSPSDDADIEVMNISSSYACPRLKYCIPCRRAER